jgi:hypothetical protein
MNRRKQKQWWNAWSRAPETEVASPEETILMRYFPPECHSFRPVRKALNALRKTPPAPAALVTV